MCVNLFSRSAANGDIGFATPITMASYQLGPESPRPFSVLSEGHIRRRIDLPHIPEYERHRFGKAYEDRMFELIHQYLELGTDDRLCYAGEAKGSFAPLLQEKFCLLEPVTTVLAGHLHYEESANHHMLPIKIADIGAEEYFRREASNPATFDKIILKDAIQFFDEPQKCYENMMRSLAEFGKILVIHRPAQMNTLPLFTDAKDRLMENDQPFLSIIRDLQDVGLDVQWEIQCVPIIMPRLTWMSMVREKFPAQLEIVSSHEIKSGIRELNEGVLKYGGDIVEFADRLLFITAHRPVFSKHPSIQRFGKSAHEQLLGTENLKYKMEVTKDIGDYLKAKEKKSQRKLIR